MPVSSESRTPPEEMTREELETEVEHLRGLEERVDELEEELESRNEVEFRGDGKELEDLWIGVQPVGRLLTGADKRSKEALDAAESDGDSPGASAAARGSALDVHVNWFDLRDGRGDSPSKNRRRAAVLFHRFIQRAGGETDVGVEKSHGKYRMKGKRAKQILMADDTDVNMPANGVSKTARRAMRFVQEGTKRDDCGCDDYDRCKHGLIVFKRDDGYSLTADRDAFHEYLRTVGEAVEGGDDHADDATTADGSRGTGTDVHEDVEEEFQQLEAATSEDEFADSVVSSNQEGLSATSNRPMEETSDD